MGQEGAAEQELNPGVVPGGVPWSCVPGWSEEAPLVGSRRRLWSSLKVFWDGIGKCPGMGLGCALGWSREVPPGRAESHAPLDEIQYVKGPRWSWDALLTGAYRGAPGWSIKAHLWVELGGTADQEGRNFWRNTKPPI
jgi:hypothetical protein